MLDLEEHEEKDDELKGQKQQESKVWERLKEFEWEEGEVWAKAIPREFACDPSSSQEHEVLLHHHHNILGFLYIRYI